MEGLGPNDDPARIAAETAAETRDLLVVGHLPHLARLAGLLLAGDPGRAVVEFRMGALVRIHRDAAGTRLVWAVPPDGLA